MGLGGNPGSTRPCAKPLAYDPMRPTGVRFDDAQISVEPIKRGRSIRGVRLSWSQRDPSGRAAVARELEASRVGRKARRDGTAETIVGGPQEASEASPGAFPVSGSIRYGALTLQL
jgi:hypothetical protein